MKTKEFLSIEKTLLQSMPGFSIKGRLMLMSPMKHILRGIWFDGSDFDTNSFYATYFVMPLCIPTKHLILSFGNRLRYSGGDRWNVNDPNALAGLSATIVRDAVPFLSRAESLLGFVEVAKTFSNANPHTAKAIAFSLARAGHVDEAVSVLNQLLLRLDLNVAWQQEMADLAKDLKTKLVANPSEAQQQLEAWEAESARNLGLEDFRRVAAI